MSEPDFEKLLGEQPYQELSPDLREGILTTAFAEHDRAKVHTPRLLWNPKSLALLTAWVVMALLKWSTPDISMDFPMAMERSKNPEPLSPSVLLASSSSFSRPSK